MEHDLVDDFASTRMELATELLTLAERPERLLACSPDELLEHVVMAYRSSFQALRAASASTSRQPEDAPIGQGAPVPPASQRAAIEPDPPKNPKGAPDGVGQSARPGLKDNALTPDRDDDAADARLRAIVTRLTQMHDSGDTSDIQHAIDGMLTQGLPPTPRPTLSELAHLLVAMLRRADEGAFFEHESRRRTAAAFRRLREGYTEPEQVYVHGMARAHTPAHGETWEADAGHYLGLLS